MRWLCSTPSLTPPKEQPDLCCPSACHAVPSRHSACCHSCRKESRPAGVTPAQGRLHTLHKPQVLVSGSQPSSGHDFRDFQGSAQCASCSQRYLCHCLTALIAALHCKLFLPPHNLQSHPLTDISWAKLW